MVRVGDWGWGRYGQVRVTIFQKVWECGPKTIMIRIRVGFGVREVDSEDLRFIRLDNLGNAYD